MWSFLSRLIGGGGSVPDYSEGTFLTARINMKMMPIDRGHFLEDPLGERLAALGIGQVTGGGTQLEGDPFGIAYVDLELHLAEVSEETLDRIVEELEDIGVAKGSRLIDDESRDLRHFGTLEGLALFLNGTDLPEEVYRDFGADDVLNACERALGPTGRFYGSWDGERETGLYFYGASYNAMLSAIEKPRRTVPLCDRSWVDQIA